MARGARKPRLSDVAERAGVSRTTASYILNGRSVEMRISTDAVQRVGVAVAELGYRPNRTARNLRTARTSTVGLISDHVASGHFASRMLTGASAAARDLDHLLVIGESDGDPLLEQVIVEQMLDQGVDGIVYASLHHREVTPPPALRHGRTILLNCVDDHGLLPAVVPDERDGGRRVVDAVAHVDGPVVVVGDPAEQGTRAGMLRMAGITERLAELDREVAELLRCDWSVEAARVALTAATVESGVVVCLNDRIAMGAYQALAARGLDVPGDVAVVSFDGSELAGWLSPALTSAALPFVELGDAAVRRLLEPGPRAPRSLRLAMPVTPGGSVPAARSVGS